MRPPWRIIVPALAAGVCALSIPSMATTTSGSPAKCAHPADVLDLTNWKETLPTGSEGDPDEVTQPDLAGFSADPWFVPTAECDGVRFRAAVNGVTTSGSDYPRSELREMTGDGSEEASWSTTDGTSTMKIEAAVTHLPEDKDQIVVGQIHGEDDDLTVFRFEGSDVYVTKGDDSHYKLVTSDYKPGTRFTASFVAGDGRITAYFNGERVAAFDDDSSGNYFKAGAYTQANCDNSSPCDDGNYGEAVIYGLTVTHD